MPPLRKLGHLVTSTLIDNPEVFFANAAALRKDPAFLELLRRAKEGLGSSDELYTEAIVLVTEEHGRQSEQLRGGGRSSESKERSKVGPLVACALSAAFILVFGTDPVESAFIMSAAGFMLGAETARARGREGRVAARRYAQEVLERTDLLLKWTVAVLLIKRKETERLESE